MVNPTRHFVRHAFTLIELAIILAILSIFAAISWPVMMRPWQQSHVQREAEHLREILGNARHTAIKQAATYEFRFKPGTNEYEIRSRDPMIIQPIESPVDPRSPAPTSEPETASPNVSGDTDRMLLDEQIAEESPEPKREHHFLVRGRLADGIIFAPERKEEAEDESIAGQPLGRSDENGSSSRSIEFDANQQDKQHEHHFQWAHPIAFQPSGRTSNMELDLQSDDGFSITVSMRGFTGAVSICSVFETPSETEEDLDVNALGAIDSPIPEQAERLSR